MHSEGANLPVIEIDSQYHNLIPSRFPPVPVYERIANGNDAYFAAVEELTNPRVREKQRLTKGIAAVDEQSPRLQSWNHAPFAYPNPEGSKFYGRDRNVVELAADLQTALAVSVIRRENFLKRTSEPATAIEIRQLTRKVTGSFIDARNWKGISDRERRLNLGEEAVSRSLDGIIFHPHERPSANSVVVLKPDCLGRPNQAEHFKFLWNGNCITVLYAFGADKTYDPTDLQLPNDILAA
ncbi:RES domain-containing protein [Sphingorhabdus sp. EL138]|uniref:RES domain-containing protein n=1 Tax=Sphingorhabdus sp. EL138 TaxID=2073156 RepID=UPI000D69C05C|nr:RES domain-containing protein [Sphingorhabdus sp. EL138]